MVLPAKKHFHILFVFVVVFFLYFQLVFWKNFYVGILLFALYILLLTPWWQEIFHKIFCLDKKAWLTRIFSWLAVFLVLGFASSIAVVFYKFTPFIIWTRFVAVAIISLAIWFLARKEQGTRNKPACRQGRAQVIEDNNEILFKKNITYHLSFIIYFILWLVGLYLLYKSQSSLALQSPWQTINQYHLPIFFVLTFLSGIFLFVKFRIKTILFILVLQSLLLHLYLPLSHQNPWGGDVWRHIAVEKQLENGEQVLPVLIGEKAEWREFAAIDLPKVFFSPQKFAYGHLWGTSVLLSQTLQINLIAINKWLVPIVWSLAIPFILFRIGWLIFDSRRKGLWLAWLSLLPFPLQALGALTLPVSLGYITVLFVLMFWLQYLRDGSRVQRNLVLFLAVLMLFGYTLHFILMWLAIILSFIIYHLLSSNKIFQTTLLFLSLFIFSVIELLAKISRLPASINCWSNIKQAIGQFSGWFYASAVCPHDILSGNIIFNHTPDYAFVSNIFTDWRWWLIPAMAIIWILVGIGIYRFVKLLITNYHLLIFLFFVVFGGYLIGWFVLEGDRLLTRRLDAMLVILFLIFIIQALSFIIYHLSNNKYLILNKIFIIIIILLFSWFTAFTYASGPDMRVVSQDEFNVANYIYNPKSEVRSPICVLADTWVLLPLEALSAGRVVGGGFPIDYQFSQPERVKLFEEFSKNPSAELLNEAKEITLAEECWFAAKMQNVKIKMQNDELFGTKAVEIGEMGVWGLKNVEK